MCSACLSTWTIRCIFLSFESGLWKVFKNMTIFCVFCLFNACFRPLRNVFDNNRYHIFYITLTFFTRVSRYIVHSISKYCDVFLYAFSFCSISCVCAVHVYVWLVWKTFVVATWAVNFTLILAHQTSFALFSIHVLGS